MHKSLLSSFDLTGKVAIITGASRGLGVSFASGLAKAGCDVVVAARDVARLQSVAEELRQLGRRALPVRADISKPEDCEAMVARAIEEFGRLDILVNNAGISAVADAENMTGDQWQRVLDTNVTGLFFCARLFAVG